MTVREWVASPVGDPRHRLGEGPHWDSTRGRLSWVDIATGELWAEDADGVTAQAWGEPLGMAVPHVDGGWVCGLGRGLALVGEDGELEQRLEVEPLGVRMNDGKCDSAGRLYVGSKAHDNAPGAGNLWRLDLDGTVSRVRRGLTIANGLGWSPDDRTMYVTDSAAGRVDAHDYDLATGVLGEARRFLEIPNELGAPDGLAVDTDGFLWVALWGGAQVCRFAPDGEPAGVVRVAASHTTSCTFSGPDLTRLSITTAWDELTDERRAAEPDAGRRFEVEVGVRGAPGQPCRVVRSGWAQAIALE